MFGMGHTKLVSSVTHVTSALLTNLAHGCFKVLPSDAHTLKKTPTSIQLKPVDSGQLLSYRNIPFVLKTCGQKCMNVFLQLCLLLPLMVFHYLGVFQMNFDLF